jgi:DNA-binding NarL/FixJ family response regulator
MSILQGDKTEIFLSRRERNTAMAFFALIGGLTVFDIIEDSLDGAPLAHIIPEVVTAILALIAAVVLFGRFARDRANTLEVANEKIRSERAVSGEWRQLAESYQKGITEGIVKQFQQWGLTAAEQDVCFFLLKGFTLQEIAELRTTSERTVRQQASVIYKKSGLSGRAQLSAFFLEDLLAPASESELL